MCDRLTRGYIGGVTMHSTQNFVGGVQQQPVSDLIQQVAFLLQVVGNLLWRCLPSCRLACWLVRLSHLKSVSVAVVVCCHATTC
jgi:hypothetical protein